MDIRTIWTPRAVQCMICGKLNGENGASRMYEINGKGGRIFICNECSDALPTTLKKWEVSKDNAKLVVKVKLSGGRDNEMTTLSVFDARTGETYEDSGFISERGIQKFGNYADMKETLNWNLNGDSSKFKFKRDRKKSNVGYAYIFD